MDSCTYTLIPTQLYSHPQYPPPPPPLQAPLADTNTRGGGIVFVSFSSVSSAVDATIYKFHPVFALYSYPSGWFAPPPPLSEGDLRPARWTYPGTGVLDRCRLFTFKDLWNHGYYLRQMDTPVIDNNRQHELGRIRTGNKSYQCGWPVYYKLLLELIAWSFPTSKYRTGRLMKHFYNLKKKTKGLCEELYSRTGKEGHPCCKSIINFILSFELIAWSFPTNKF
jgi:hypothetical protein